MGRVAEETRLAMSRRPLMLRHKSAGGRDPPPEIVLCQAGRLSSPFLPRPTLSLSRHSILVTSLSSPQKASLRGPLF